VFFCTEGRSPAFAFAFAGSDNRARFRILKLFALCAALLLSSPVAWGLPAWQSGLTKDPPGNFSELRPLRANYNFGWSGLTAATAETHFTKTSDNRFQLEASGHTVGLVRALWRYDINLRTVTEVTTLRPIENTQNETVRSKKTTTHLSFTNAGVNRSRIENGTPSKGKDFAFPNLFDLQSAMLYLRSQPLKDRSAYRIVVYPTTSAYLATLTVTAREKINVRAGSFNAIKLDLQLSKLGKTLELEPHRKFRKASIWLSDDPDRLILRVEAQIFVGSVFAELQSVKFDSAKP
jgi:hypothetical protein